MDFGFIGGSMGSVVGERIARTIRYALEHKLPLLMISRSGGARMMEGSLSLVQMAKTAVWLAQYAKVGLPYISLMTDPTMGGGYGELRYAGGYQPCGTESPNRFCRAKGHPRSYGKRLTRRLPGSRISVGARLCGPHRRSAGAQKHPDTLVGYAVWLENGDVLSGVNVECSP